MTDHTKYLREAKQKAICRYCNGFIQKGEKMFSFYSVANTGMWIHLHTRCVEIMNEVIEKDKHEETNDLLS